MGWYPAQVLLEQKCFICTLIYPHDIFWLPRFPTRRRNPFDCASRLSQTKRAHRIARCQLSYYKFPLSSCDVTLKRVKQRWRCRFHQSRSSCQRDTKWRHAASPLLRHKGVERLWWKAMECRGKVGNTEKSETDANSISFQSPRREGAALRALQKWFGCAFHTQAKIRWKNQEKSALVAW